MDLDAIKERAGALRGTDSIATIKMRWSSTQSFFQRSERDMELLLAEIERLQRIEQAVRDYCAINGIERYNRLIAALNNESEAS